MVENTTLFKPNGDSLASAIAAFLVTGLEQAQHRSEDLFLRNHQGIVHVAGMCRVHVRDPARWCFNQCARVESEVPMVIVALVGQEEVALLLR